MGREVTEVELISELAPIVEAHVERHPAARSDAAEAPRASDRMGGGFDDADLADPPSYAAIRALVGAKRRLSAAHPRYADFDGAWRRWLTIWSGEEKAHVRALESLLAAADECGEPAPAPMPQLDSARAQRHPDGVEFCGSAMRALVRLTFEERAHQVLAGVVVERLAVSSGAFAGIGAIERAESEDRLHANIFQELCAAALELAPGRFLDATAAVVADLRVPGTGIDVALISGAHIYDEQTHLRAVLHPVLGAWRLFERTDLPATTGGALSRLADTVGEAERSVERAARGREIVRARAAHAREREAAFLARMGVLSGAAM